MPEDKHRIYGLGWRLLLPIVLIGLGLISTILLLVERHKWDGEYRDVVACLDYNALFQLAGVSGVSLGSVLSEFHNLGYRSIAVAEMTVLSASEKGYLFEVSDDLLITWAAENPELKEALPALLSRRNFCLLGEERRNAAAARLGLAYGGNFLSAKVNPERLQTPESAERESGKAWYLFSIPREAEVDFNKVGLGFDPAEWRTARAAGFDVVPRIVNNPKHDARDIRALFSDLDKVSILTAQTGTAPDVRVILFEGDAVPGYPGNLGVTAEEVGKRGWYWGWIEFEIQDGASTLASLLAPGIVLTHSISAEEMISQTPLVARARFLRALKERNVRLIYVRPFFVGISEPVGGNTIATSALDFNIDYFRDLKAGLDRHGFRIAREPVPIKFVDPTPLKLLIVLGIIAFIVLVIRIFFRGIPWVEPAFWALAILVSVLFFFKSTATLYSGLALALAIFTPVAAVLVSVAAIGRGRQSVPAPYGSVFAAFLRGVLISALGGMMIYALLNSERAFLKADVFHGVVLALALPVLVIALYMWDIRSFWTDTSSPLPSWVSRFNALLARKVEFVDMMVVFLGLALLALILMRSGNEAPIGVAELEVLFRERLEDFLSIRPRTKEIVGFPLFFFFLAYFFRRKPPSIVLLLVGTLAFTSVVNTFCHLHTPIAVSLTRTVLSVTIGMISGSILYLLYRVYLYLIGLFSVSGAGRRA